MAKVLVMGGNYYFGKKLVQNLIDENHHVTVLNRGSRADDFGDKITRLVCDRHNYESLNAAIQDSYDIVFDQCCFEYDQAKLACEIFKGKVKRYIFTSSASVYNQYGSAIREENFNPFDYAFEKKETVESDYGEAKRQAEAGFFKHASFPVVAVRFPIVLDAQDATGRLQFHVERVKKEGPIYFQNIDGRISFICADDAAYSLNQLAQSDFSGSINAASPLPISLRDVMEIIENVAGKKAKFASERAQNNLSPYNIEEDWNVNCSKLENLGIKLTPIKSYLPEMVGKIIELKPEHT